MTYLDILEYSIIDPVEACRILSFIHQFSAAHIQTEDGSAQDKEYLYPINRVISY